MTNPHDPQVPPFGSHEYEQWYRANVDPTWPSPQGPLPPKRKLHLLAWSLGVIALLVIGGITAGAVTSTHTGAKASADKHPAATTPAAAKVPCVNSANLCPASDPTDHSVADDPATEDNSELDQLPTDDPTTDDTSTDTAMGTPIGDTITVTETDYDGTESIADVTVNSVNSYNVAGDSDDAIVARERPIRRAQCDREGHQRQLRLQRAVFRLAGSGRHNLQQLRRQRHLQRLRAGTGFRHAARRTNQARKRRFRRAENSRRSGHPRGQ